MGLCNLRTIDDEISARKELFERYLERLAGVEGIRLNPPQKDVVSNYAYCPVIFDEKVFAFNCDWFKCINPFDEVPIFDIRGYVHNFLVDDDYKTFCEKNNRFTDTGNYSTTAETVFQYVTGEVDFEEAHTALSDAEIETEILFNCVERGATLGRDYKAKRSIERPQEKTLHIRTAEQEDFYFDYFKIRINKDKTEIKLG